MLNKIRKKINSLPKKRASVFYDNMLVFLLGDGNREKAIIKFKNLRVESNSEEAFHEAFKKEINYDFFNALKQHLNFNSISGSIRSIKAIKEYAPELKKLVTNQRGLDKLLDNKNGLRSIVIKTIFYNKKEADNQEQLMEIIFKEFSISKERIANEEFGVDKKTFNKWLEETGLFKEEFYKPLSERGKKGVYLDEYVHIFETLFLAKEEGKLDIENNIDTYIDRLNNKMYFQKDDIVQICESNIKTQKEVLRKLAYYNFINKFPYSLSRELVNKMWSEINY